MTKTKYVLTGLMIFFGILFLGGFFLPFYSANIVGSLGSQSVNGSLTASGIGFILGLSAIKTGYFETKNIFVQQNILIANILQIIASKEKLVEGTIAFDAALTQTEEKKK